MKYRKTICINQRSKPTHTYTVINDITLCRLSTCNHCHCINSLKLKKLIKFPIKINKQVIRSFSPTSHNSLLYQLPPTIPLDITTRAHCADISIPFSRSRPGRTIRQIPTSSQPNCRQTYHYQQYHQLHQIGGGKESAVIDLTTAHSPTKTRMEVTQFDNPIYPSNVQQRGIISLADNIRPSQSWRPSTHLPTRRGDHILENLLPVDLKSLLIPATQCRPNQVILYTTLNPIQNVTTRHIQELLTHGSMTCDSILNTFLDILCTEHRLHH